jgi:Tfp pilus assembly protein PilF
LTPLARNNQAYLIAEYEPTPENLTRAQKLISQTLEDFPEDPSFLDTMGWVLCKQGNFVEARTYLEKALDKAQNQPVVLYHLGWCEAKLGEAAAARENLRKALDSTIKFPQREEAQKLLESLSAEDKAG